MAYVPINQQEITSQTTSLYYCVSSSVKKLFSILMISGILTSCGLLGIGGHKSTIPGKIVFSAPDNDGNGQIFSMNTDGSHLKQLTQATDGGAYNPNWSPDGKQIAFDNYSGATTMGSYVYVMNSDGSQMRPLKKRSTESPKALVGSGPVWSPDGTQIAYNICSNCELGGNNFDIVIVDVAGENYDPKQIHRIINNPTRDIDPAWSPNGQQIAFLSDRDYSNGDSLQFRMDIYVENVDGTSVKRLTHDGYVGAPVWNSNGRTITYSSSKPSYNLYQVDLQTGKISKIETGLSGRYVITPVDWSPDDQILLINAREQEYPRANNLYMYDTQNDTLEEVYSKSAYDNSTYMQTGFDWFVPINN